MAIQAQHPSSNTFMADLRNSSSNNNRARASPVGRDNRNLMAPGSVMPISLTEAFQLQPNISAANLFPVYNSVAGLNFGQQHVLNGTVFSDPESELTCNNMSGSRKRAREDEIMLTQHQRQQISQLTLMNMNMSMNMNMNMNMADLQQKNAAAAVTASLPQSLGLVPTGLQLAYEDARLNNPAPASTSARNTNPSSSSNSSSSTRLCIFGDDLTAQMQRHQEEIDQLITMHNEKIRIAVEEKRQRHNRVLVAALEEGILRRLEGKDAELEKASRKNAELEERLKQLSVESQIWQNVAKNNESIANTLRANLEQVLVQTREQSREGRGDSEAEDAQSCCHDSDADDAHSRTLRENIELKEQRICRVCRSNSCCILLLPCRHLCVCKDCDTRLENCPLCKSTKNASVQVYMS
ncbi:hypothetical protein SUGI_0392540 [Cryptomeria japonica]|uniref:probable BOI-related E3 ubiquitin-protein ligase 3 n=1 Tax=Cryptomeria japonica TaxID=3369 RepID=UPI002408B3B3|nr:probable BOI-related E3 ubiquitin-protein ligase 3 [Cryptomeria japonica]GLJ21344.1 hypothetical protein SUGI_0392540 [Cryptomeria japonica]